MQIKLRKYFTFIVLALVLFVGTNAKASNTGNIDDYGIEIVSIDSNYLTIEFTNHLSGRLELEEIKNISFQPNDFQNTNEFRYVNSSGLTTWTNVFTYDFSNSSDRIVSIPINVDPNSSDQMRYNFSYEDFENDTLTEDYLVEMNKTPDNYSIFKLHAYESAWEAPAQSVSKHYDHAIYLPDLMNGRYANRYTPRPIDVSLEHKFDNYYVNRDGINVRSQSSNDIVAIFDMGDYVSGKDGGSYINFYYEGQNVKIYKDYTSKVDPQTYFVNSGVNVRNQDMEIIGRKNKNDIVNAARVGSYLRFIENGQVKFIYHSYASDKPSLSTYYVDHTSEVMNSEYQVVDQKSVGTRLEGYVSGNYFVFSEDGQKRMIYLTNMTQTKKKYPIYATMSVNVRAYTSGSIIGSLRVGDYIDGVIEGDQVVFTYKGKKAKVYAPYTITENPQNLYIAANVNERGQNMELVGSASKGKSIYGVRIGDYYRYYDDGVKLVWYSYVSHNVDGAAYANLTGVNVRSQASDNVIGVKYLGEYIEGTRANGRLYFNYEGTSAYIDDSVLLYTTGRNLRITSNVNVRDRYLNLVGSLSRNDTIYGVRMGDYYRFYDNGVKFVYHIYAR